MISLMANWGRSVRCKAIPNAIEFWQSIRDVSTEPNVRLYALPGLEEDEKVILSWCDGMRYATATIRASGTIELSCVSVENKIVDIEGSQKATIENKNQVPRWFLSYMGLIKTDYENETYEMKKEATATVSICYLSGLPGRKWE